MPSLQVRKLRHRGIVRVALCIFLCGRCLQREDVAERVVTQSPWFQLTAAP